MTYINPYLANNMESRKGRNLFQEASDLGYLIRNSSGHPYILASGSSNFTFGTLCVCVCVVVVVVVITHIYIYRYIGSHESRRSNMVLKCDSM